MSNSQRTAPFILMVDDDPDDVFLTRRAFLGIKWTGQFDSVNSGEEMFLKLGRASHESFENPDTALPDIIILDLNMPGVDGFQILERMRMDQRLRHLPVVVMSTSQAEPDIQKAYSMGANSFISKPTSNQGMTKMVKLLSDYWFELCQMPKSTVP